MACPNYWDSPFRVGSHHLARGFAQSGWDVAYISDPISPFHWIAGVTPELRERFQNYRAGGVQWKGGSLWAYVPGALLTPHNKPLLRSSWVIRNWPRLSLPNVIGLLETRGFGEVDVLYIDSIAQRFWLDRVRHKHSVYRVADRSTGFTKSTSATIRVEQELAEAADLVVYTAQSLRSHVESLGAKRVLHLPNGVDFRHFAAGDRSPPPELMRIPRPIAIYVGAMDAWFDYDLTNFVARRLPRVSFVFIGPDELARLRLQPRINVHLLGRRPYEHLPRYLHNADVGLIPFNTAKHREIVNSIHPLKLYEYMACGLPVVATTWEELRNIKSPATLASDGDTFVAGIEHALSTPPDSAANVRFASFADWRNRMATLLQALRSEGGAPASGSVAAGPPQDRGA